MKEPWFWQSDSLTARVIKNAMAPLSALYLAGYRARVTFSQPTTSAIPIICIGNATLGGTGKTPFALALHQGLSAAGVNAHFITRGYGGTAKGPLQVDLNTHQYSDVGDEALLLASQAVTWVGADRNKSASCAAKAGAKLAIMDDGFQNPTIAKSYSILLDDGTSQHGRLFPAGRLREPFAWAKERADRLVRIGDSATLDGSARLRTSVEGNNESVVAFCGIAGPERFVATLCKAGFNVVDSVFFPDHHGFSNQDLETLRARAATHKATLITTQKDFVRIPDDFQPEIKTLPVTMEIDDIDAIVADIMALVEDRPDHG